MYSYNTLSIHGEFFCEGCDRGFKTQELLDAHVAEHIVCGRDGCIFSGHPKIVENHVKFQHETGLFNSIVISQNPEEVAKWIAARKSRYPTKENVEKKEAQNSEMIQRGERIPVQGKSLHNKESWQDRKRRRNQNAKNVCGTGNDQQQRKKPVMSTKDESKWKDDDAWRGDLPKFPGTAAFPLVKDKPVDIDEGKHFSDDEPELNTKQDVGIVSKPLFSSVLASLMMNYGSDTDDESKDTIASAPTNSSLQIDVLSISNSSKPGMYNKTEGDNLLTQESQVRKEQDDPDSGPEEVIIQREDTSNAPVPKPENQNNKSQENQTVESKTEAARPPRPKPPVRPQMKRIQLSLLEKLLQNEIRQERNAILQCIRYVVNNNFFGCGSSH